MNTDLPLREKLVDLLRGAQTRMPFTDAVADFPEDLINTKPPNVPYTFWHLVEHLRIMQWDILDFSRNPNYKYSESSEKYWPPRSSQANKKQWDESVAKFSADLEEMISLVKNPESDLYTPFSWGQGQNLLREALVLADHNSYHIGELAILRQVVNAWPKK